MPLVTTSDMYLQAQHNGYAVAGFAAYNLETIRALIETADALRAPVLVQTTPSNIDNIGLEYLVAVVRIAAGKASVPVALHLDHGDSLTRIEQCIRHGFTSVMIDGSVLPYDDNLSICQEAVRMAHDSGVVVEAELGHVAGVEDDNLSNVGKGMFTDPDMAREFVWQTKVDSLAVAIGTAHGVYQGEPLLDFERLSAIAKRVPVPLVLHGASGVPDEAIRESIRRGITKINIATELKIPYARALRQFLIEHPNEFDPRIYFKPGQRAYEEVVKQKILLVGANGRYANHHLPGN